MSAWNTDQGADFRGPLDVTRAATVVTDARNTVIGWSLGAERLFGYRSREIVGRPLTTFL
ncbi:PAS domain-containing protein, partial [Streptomyces parvulus]